MRRGRTALLVGVATSVGCLLVGSSIAMAAPASAHMCIPIIWPCDDPAPVPSPPPSASPVTTNPTAPSTPSLPGRAGGTGRADTGGTDAGNGDAAPTPAPSAPAPEWSPAGDDDSAVFTQPSAQLGATSISFSGLKGVTLVKVRLADGTRVDAIRLRADRIVIGGFALTVRAATGPSLVTTADTMTLEGHVAVYVNSLTATTADGRSYTLGANTPPPKDGVVPSLVRATLGLVGSTADSIHYTNTDQRLSE